MKKTVNQIEVQYFESKIGELITGTFKNSLCLLDFKNRKMRLSVDNRLKTKLSAKYVIRNNKILTLAKTQIGEYLSGLRKEFSIPIITVGSNFQKQVWYSIMKLKYGEIASYLDIAISIGNQKAVRAVANANGANSLALIIPCHRILGNDGALVGYGGGVPIKKKLLNLEKVNTSI